MTHAVQEQTVVSQPCFVERDSYYLQAQPPFDAHAFLDERAVAFDPGAPTGFTASPTAHREAETAKAHRG